jgi:tetraacyldisaccharide 4'-kinase
VGSDDDPAVVGDEPVLLARRTGCPVAAGPNRAAAAAQLLESAPVDVIVSDDGLQHYRLRRAFEIVVVDGQRGLGNGRCLPAGPLREPASRLDEVAAVVVNDAAADSSFGGAEAFRSVVCPLRVVELATGTEKSVDDFRGQTVHAVAAIGNPDRFFGLLSRRGVAVVPHAFSDHALLSPTDLSFAHDHPVLMTEKDAVKCEPSRDLNLWCVVTELEFASGDGDRLERKVVDHLQRMPENK